MPATLAESGEIDWREQIDVRIATPLILMVETYIARPNPL